MNRLITWWAMVALMLPGCAQKDGGPADPAGEEQFYALFFDEVMERGETWWGYPPPTSYCVAIAPGSMEPDLEHSRDPSQAVLDRLRRANGSKEFHSYSTCSGGYPFKAPTGEAAGLLWVAPLDTTDRVTLSGGWTAQRDLTEWGCTFVETGGTVELRACSLWFET